MTTCTVKYRVETPSIPGVELPLIERKETADKIAARTTKAGYPSSVVEVLLRKN